MTATSASPPAPENETEPRTEAAPAVRTEEEESELGAKEEERRKKDAAAAALTLEIVGDLPHADVKPPENVLFVCKLNPVTRSEDLELIFSRFGKICSCEVIKDKKTGDSLQYAFIEFEERASAEQAYTKMQNVLIDDRRIWVDFSQSVSKLHGVWVKQRTGKAPSSHTKPSSSHRSYDRRQEDTRHRDYRSRRYDEDDRRRNHRSHRYEDRDRSRQRYEDRGHRHDSYERRYRSRDDRSRYDDDRQDRHHRRADRETSPRRES
ncbi:Peptidyl-prolyl cis-trans isomerase-like 4 [Malassezia pachydermatis]|uniref:peptidylprolyl isomerase n=1 Tax=Malassezia pachydermatis TaxID=77020 RepID=A0A0M8MU98_9BASI|nr:cyclophilin-like protein [Malassezia pachydermatis]KOS13920.1 cyclophilin-like protein [Malassezia pachydermatis]